MVEQGIPDDVLKTLAPGEGVVEMGVLSGEEPEDGVEVALRSYGELGLLAGAELGPGASLLEHPETGELYAIHHRLHVGASLVEILDPERYPDPTQRPFLTVPSDAAVRVRQVA